eukprot:2409412-Pleurochrysis_carterae.AAC.1
MRDAEMRHFKLFPLHAAAYFALQFPSEFKRYRFDEYNFNRTNHGLSSNSQEGTPVAKRQLLEMSSILAHLALTRPRKRLSSDTTATFSTARRQTLLLCFEN